MSDNKHLLDTYLTALYKNRITQKKQTYKSLYYNKRLYYGFLESIGIVSQDLRLLPFENDLKIDKPFSLDNKDENQLNCLINSNINIRESKREIKLKKMLYDKLDSLKKLNDSLN